MQYLDKKINYILFDKAGNYARLINCGIGKLLNDFPHFQMKLLSHQSFALSGTLFNKKATMQYLKKKCTWHKRANLSLSLCSLFSVLTILTFQLQIHLQLELNAWATTVYAIWQRFEQHTHTHTHKSQVKFFVMWGNHKVNLLTTNLVRNLCFPNEHLMQYEWNTIARTSSGPPRWLQKA